MHVTIPFASLFSTIALLAIGTSSREAPRQPLRFSGDVHVESFHVPIGKTVVVTDDLHLTAASSILIEGTLEVRPRSTVDTRGDGPAVWLTAAASIEVTESGRILGARGRNHVARGGRGGTGSNVLLEAPVVWVDGAVVGGNGGASGPGMKGGKGGEVRVRGSYLKRSKRLLLPGERPSSGLFGGNGGPGGAGVLAGESGGEGGDGGDAIGGESEGSCLALVRVGEGTRTQGHPEISYILGMNLEPGPAPFATGQGAGQGCPKGTDGTSAPTINNERTGHIGAQGIHGTPAVPDAGNGGPGGEGGDAMGGRGGDGAGGASCCDPPMNGGQGGTGGKGGDAISGNGGRGGEGGIGYLPTGKGGNGGDGGSAGKAFGGDGGNGGRGGKPYGLGGPGGLGGQAGSGNAGAPGKGGEGNPPESPGSAGNAGSVYGGNRGNSGPAGGSCDR